jgi:putative membrane protein
MMSSGFGGWGGNGLLGGMGMIFMGIIPLLVIGLIVWAIVEGTRRRDDHPVAAAHYYQSPATSDGPGARIPAAAPASPARALLDERYARGEMGRDEYLQRRGDLG